MKDKEIISLKPMRQADERAVRMRSNLRRRAIELIDTAEEGKEDDMTAHCTRLLDDIGREIEPLPNPEDYKDIVNHWEWLTFKRLVKRHERKEP